MLWISMFFIGLLCWLTATVTAGGAGLIFLTVAGFVLPITEATMILAFAGTVAGLYRTWIYRSFLDWEILKWLLPGTLLGSIMGSLLFKQLLGSQHSCILHVFLGIILLLSGAGGVFNIKLTNLPAKRYYFLPVGIFTSFLSGLIGVSGALNNSLFQKFSLFPNQIIGTKSFNIFSLQLAKTLIFFFGIVLNRENIPIEGGLTSKGFFVLGCMTALGASVGVFIGKKITSKINEFFFCKILNVMMVVYGVFLIIFSQQLTSSYK